MKKSIILLTALVALFVIPNTIFASESLEEEVQSPYPINHSNDDVQSNEMEKSMKQELPEENDHSGMDEKQVQESNQKALEKAQATTPEEEMVSIEELPSEEIVENTTDNREVKSVEVKNEGLNETTGTTEMDEQNVKENTELTKPEKEEEQKEQPKATTFSVQSKSTYQLKDSHNTIAKYKEKLNSIGFGGILVTDYFGDYTEKKVKQFQRNYGLSANGKLDKQTMSMIDEVYHSPFQVGNSDPKISELKERLNRMGFSGILVTDYYGNYTAKKVKEFQKFAGIKANGIADSYTRAKLDNLIANGFKQGDSHREIADVKKRLNKIGFNGITVTNYYGSYTAKKVREFQSYYGLEKTGKVNGETIDKIYHVYKNSYRQGMRDGDLKQIKRNLNKLGFNGITVTSYFGNYTKKQVKKFQSYYGLKSTGVVEEKTLAKMDEILSSPLQKGKRHKDLIPIKEKLNEIGFGGITVTSYFGAFTEKRVKQFQRVNNLPVSGIVDKKTKEAIMNSSNSLRVFLDPGHGGSDPGATRNGVKEKDVVLQIALKTADILLNNYLGVDVKLSRTTDRYLELEGRAEMSNQWKADYFISLHNNSFRNQIANGFETYIHNKDYSKTDKKNQQTIHQYLIDKIGINDRGMKKANYSVLRNTDAPSILIEYMFISNSKENRLLKSNSYRDWLGTITAEAIAKAYNLKRK